MYVKIYVWATRALTHQNSTIGVKVTLSESDLKSDLSKCDLKSDGLKWTSEVTLSKSDLKSDLGLK